MIYHQSNITGVPELDFKLKGEKNHERIQIH